MKKILYVVLHGSVNGQRYDNIMTTWGKDVDVLFYADYSDPEKNVVKMSERSDYAACEERACNVIRYINSNIKDYEWFFFCDDDTFVNTTKLNKIIDTFDVNSVHGHLLDGTWTPDKSLKYCSGGAGFAIHRNLLTKITPNIRVLNTNYGDVALGLCLRNMGVQSNHYDYFKTLSPKDYGIRNEDIKNYITFHYVKNYEHMKELHDLVN